MHKLPLGMLQTGKAFEQFLPEGYKFVGPGYLFISNKGLPALDLPVEVVQALLRRLE
jgi:hypothetical protein